MPTIKTKTERAPRLGRETADHGMCTMHKDEVNADLLAFVAQ